MQLSLDYKVVDARLGVTGRTRDWNVAGSNRRRTMNECTTMVRIG